MGFFLFLDIFIFYMFKAPPSFSAAAAALPFFCSLADASASLLIICPTDDIIHTFGQVLFSLEEEKVLNLLCCMCYNKYVYYDRGEFGKYQAGKADKICQKNQD